MKKTLILFFIFPLLLAAQQQDTSFTSKGDSVFMIVRSKTFLGFTSDSIAYQKYKASLPQKMPEYLRGGESKMVEFIKNNYTLTSGMKKEMKKYGYSEGGRMILTFVVNEDGSVSDVKVIQGLSPTTEDEAVRVIEMLRFRPGVQDGKPVKVNYTIPIVVKPNP